MALITSFDSDAGEKNRKIFMENNGVNYDFL